MNLTAKWSYQLNPDILSVNFEVPEFDDELLEMVKARVATIEAQIAAALFITNAHRNTEVTALATVGGQRQIRLRE